MKRFFCTKCQRIKRVQQWPNVLTDQFSENPFNRLGECNWHYGIRTLGISRERFRDDKLEPRKPRVFKAKPVQVKPVSRKRAS